MITEKMIKLGFQNHFVRLIRSPNGDGIVCQIGEYWFYFGNTDDTEGYDDPITYLKSNGEEAVLKQIYKTLEDFRIYEEFQTEYAYYDAYLKSLLLIESCRDELNRQMFVVDDDNAGKKRIVVTVGCFEETLDPIAAVKAAAKDFFKTARGKELAESHWVFTYSDFLNNVPQSCCANNGFIILGVEEITDVASNDENLNT